MSGTVRMVDPHGGVHDVPDEQLNVAAMQGFHVQTDEEENARIADLAEQQVYGGTAGALTAAGLQGLSGATLGLSDVVLRAMDPGYAAMGQALQRQHPIVSTGANIAGTVVGAALTGGSNLAGRIGEGAAARLGEGALAKVGGAAVAGGLEGSVAGFGQGVHELALSQDPLTLEHVASTLSSNMLYGGLAGAGVGGIAKGAELGLRRAGSYLAEIGKGGAAADTAEKKLLADDIAGFRASVKEQKLHLVTSGAEDRATREVAKIGLEADKSIDRVLRNPKALADKPERALASLQQQEHALESTLRMAEDLRGKFAADTSGTRATALDAVPQALERNRALQQRIVDLTAKPAAAEGIVQQMVKGQTYGGISSALDAVTDLIPGAGIVKFAAKTLRPLLAAKGSQAVSNMVFGGLSKSAGIVAERLSGAAAMVANAAQEAGPLAPPLASAVLGGIRYAEQQKRKGRPPKQDLAQTYEARAAEVRSQTAYDETGTPRATPEARQAIAKRLTPVRAVSPLTADRLETEAARRIEYLASILPRKPDAFASSLGHDQWRPTDMQIRTAARKMWAAEDPAGVLERVADGTVTPEDAEAFRTVYPEMHAAAVADVSVRIAGMKERLPYSRRLALSIFAGTPMDPALDPQILGMLQAGFASESPEGDGMSAPRPAPAFGSVSKSVGEPTPAQSRSG